MAQALAYFLIHLRMNRCRLVDTDCRESSPLHPGLGHSVPKHRVLSLAEGPPFQYTAPGKGVSFMHDLQLTVHAPNVELSDFSP